MLPGGWWPPFSVGLGGRVLPVRLGLHCVGLLACACVRIACGPAVCVGCFHRGRVPGPFRDRFGGVVAAAWWSWCRVDRWPGLLPVLAAWCGHLCWRVCVYSPGMDAGGIMAGPLGLLPAVDRLPVSLGKHGNFTEKFPEKTPTKKFFKKFPPTGERSTPEIFLQKGLTYWLPYAIVKPRKSDRARRKPLRKEVRTWTK